MKINRHISRKNKLTGFVVKAKRAPWRPGRSVQAQNRAKIEDAIETKSVLRFVYDGKERIVEPQTHGLSVKGKEVLRARQIGGDSRSGQAPVAKLFDVEKMSG